MRHLSRALRAVGWLLVVAGLTTALVLALQFIRQPTAPAGTATSDAPSLAYPPPTASVPLPTALPPGYPPPPTPFPTLSETESAAFWATEFAAATASVPATPTPIGVVIVPSTIQNMDGEFQLELFPGWRAYLGRTTLIMNYDDALIGGEGDLPPGSLNIQIGVGKLLPEQSFDQWLTEWITVQMTNFQAAGQPTLASPIPQPYVLGSHQGSSYNINTQPSFMQIILPVSDGRLIVIGMRPNDSPALPEALKMLSTLVILPVKSQ